MKIAIVSGSHRPRSQSVKVARFVQNELHFLHHETFLHDLGEDPLPFWDESATKEEGAVFQKWAPLSHQIMACQGLVVVTPEWGGMVPAALKNFFLLAADGCLYHRPALIVSVSASRNGAYPVAELHMSSAKNTHVQYISEYVIIRNVGQVLNQPTIEGQEDALVRRRLAYGLKVLLEYAKALEQVRESGVLNPKDFPWGM